MTYRSTVFRNMSIKMIMSSFLIVLLLVSIMPQLAVANKSFSDVSQNDSHYQNILDAAELGFMSGYPDGTFKPSLKLSRSNVVKALGKYVLKTSGETLDTFDVSNVQPFTDVPPTHSDQELYAYSLIVKKAKVFTGSNNNLMPTMLINRQQMAKVLVNAFNLKQVPGATSKVVDNHLALLEYRQYIDILSENNVTTVTNFRPVESATRGQFASFLVSSHRAVLSNEDLPAMPVEPNNPEPVIIPPTPLFAEDLLPLKKSVIDRDYLPKTVEVTYSDASVKNHGVVWDLKGLNTSVPGHYDLTGKVTDTNLQVALALELVGAYIAPLPPPVLIIIPYDPPAEVKMANTLIAKLPKEVKDAANAIDALGKVFEAENALNVAKKAHPELNYSHLDKVLTEQKEEVRKRQKAINATKKEAIVSVNALLDPYENNVKNAEGIVLKPIHELQASLNGAKKLVEDYEQADRKAKTTNLHGILSKQQTRINDLKTVAQLDIKANIRLVNAKDEFVSVYQTPPVFNDPAVKVIWTRWSERMPDGLPLKVTTYNDHWVIERRYTEHRHLYDQIFVEVSKGDASVRKYFYVHVPVGNLIFSNPAAHIEGGSPYLFKLK